MTSNGRKACEAAYGPDHECLGCTPLLDRCAISVEYADSHPAGLAGERAAGQAMREARRPEIVEAVAGRAFMAATLAERVNLGDVARWPDCPWVRDLQAALERKARRS